MGSVAYIIQMVSASHHYLKVVSLGQPLGVGKANGVHIPRMGWVGGASDGRGHVHGSTGAMSF